MWNMILETIVNYLSNALEWLVDGTGENKHVLTGLWLVLRYEPELHELAAKSTNTLDDKVINELIEAARRFWPQGAQAEPEIPKPME